jgi:preprotein translocase subunit SecA
MVARLLAQIFGTQNEREIKRLHPTVEHINSLEPQMQALADDELAAQTNGFRKRIMQGETLEDILPEAFAVVRETAKRTIGLRHFDVQLMGGITMHEGDIAEMKTGEGKTLVATLPLYLNALSGKGAFLVTVNDYLAKRDAAWMSPIYNFLGLSVGVLQNQMDDQERKDTYQCDIIYATNNEIGFDYLRDNMKFRLEDYVQRDLNFAIVDEIDSILIDEARTPLIISGPSDESSKLYESANQVIKSLKRDVDYEVEEKDKQVVLTEAGNDKVEQAFQLDNLYAVENIKILHHTNQALRAHALFQNDVDYVVRDNEVLIVDEFTGRILPGRRYSDGLHQALEAKEHVPVARESQTLASITLQNFFRLFSKLAGMTGTAATEAEEFNRIYKLNVVSIPTHKPLIRKDESDLIYLSKQAKYKAIIEDIRERYKKGQPILIGTVAIETSELISQVLSSSGIPHEVLNAKQHEREAEIIEHAGEAHHITIATNMAGRGTDIKPTEKAIEAGGLYVLGTERHESRRIDNQLRGRSGRQGNPGESRFYIALDDDLIRKFGGGGDMKGKMERFGMSEDEVIEGKWVSKVIESAQEKVEKRNFEARKHILEYDDVLNQQRKVVYDYRRNILDSEETIFGLIRDLISVAIEDIIAANVTGRELTDEGYHAILLSTAKLIGISFEELEERGQFARTNVDVLEKDIINFLLLRYEYYTHQSTHELTDEEQDRRIKMMLEAQKWLLLESIDQAWKQHMVNLDAVKEGIGLRQWGQKNPLIEYKKEAFTAFQDMMRHVRWEIVHYIFHINIEKFDAQAIEVRRQRELDQMQMSGTPEAGQEEQNGQESSSQKQHLSREQRRKNARKNRK